MPTNRCSPTCSRNWGVLFLRVATFYRFNLWLFEVISAALVSSRDTRGSSVRVWGLPSILCLVAVIALLVLQSSDFHLNLQVEICSYLIPMAFSQRQFDTLTVNDITDSLRHVVARGLLGWRRWGWCKAGMRLGHLAPLSAQYWRELPHYS